MRINRYRFQSKRGKILFYEDHIEDERDFPILFLHGWQSSARFYHELVKCLDGSGIRCILVEIDMDRKETGLASLKSTSKQHAADMVELLSSLGVVEYGVLAFSMFGGSIARRLTLLSREMLKCLILLSPGPCFIDSTPRHVFWNMLPEDIKSDILELEDGFLQSLIDKVASFLQEGLKPLPSNGSKSFILEDLQNMVKEFTYVKAFDPSSKDYLTNVPVQIICGELDDFIPPVLSYKVSKVFKEILFHVIPFAGHYFPLDFPEETARLIKEFVKDAIVTSSNNLKGQHSPLQSPPQV